MVRKKVLVVGGGFAGVKVALELANDRNFDVTLMTPKSRFEYHGAMYRTATGHSPLEVVLPLSEIFADALNVRVVLNTAAEIRPQTKEVEGQTGEVYKYDILIMAVGYVVNYFNIPGMAEYSENVYDVSAAIELRHRLVGKFRNAHGKPLNINIVGAGPSGVELAGDMKKFARIVAAKHDIPDLDINVNLIEAGPHVLGPLGEEVSRIAEKRLLDLGVNLRLSSAVSRCGQNYIVVNDEKVQSDITIWTAGNKANPIFSCYPDLFTTNERGRVEVSEYFNANSPDIYVIGDPANTPYTGMAQTAIHNAEALAANLKRQANNQAQMPYEPLKPACVVPIGGEWAVLQTEHGIKTGEEGWESRRDADFWVLENFLPYKKARRHWESGDRLANF